jgi:OFA family oxalate/formate antiporter-like MFS transporter
LGPLDKGNSVSTDYDKQRWVSLSVCLLANLCAGFGYSWSVFLKPMTSMFGWSGSSVSLSFTALISAGAVTAILVGKAGEYLHPRHLMLIGGVLFGAGIIALGSTRSLGHLYGFTVLAGVGMGVVYPGATMSNGIRSFPDKRGLASGLLTAGYGLGAVIWAPVSVYLVDALGLRWALRVLGITFFVIIATCSALVRLAPHGYRPAGWSPPTLQTSRVVHWESKDWKAMMRTPSFFVLFLLFLVGTTSGLMVIGHASPIAQDMLGISAEAAGRVVSFLALGVVLGKITWGVVSDKIGRLPVFVALLAIAAAALLTMWQVTSQTPVVIAMAAVGTCYGGFLSLMGPVTADRFGPRHLGVNFGIMFMTIAVASYVGSLLVSSVTEAGGGTYERAFLTAGVISAAGLILVACLFLLRRRSTPAAPATPVAAHLPVSADA